MNWMDKLERKYGKYAIPNITRVFIIATLVGYAFQAFFPVVMEYIQFGVPEILKGQIWRIVSWLFIPVSSGSIWSLLFIICLLSLGSNLEYYFGTFRMNMYFFMGVLINIIGGLLFYFIFRIPVQLSMYYILFCMYLMLGIYMPEAEVRLYFVLPIKMKWMVIVFLLELLYEIFSAFKVGFAYASAYSQGTLFAIRAGLSLSGAVIFALINLIVFVLAGKRRVSLKHKKRQREFKSQFSQPRPGSGIGQHKCAICGRTELDDPTLVFRYCSKCEGNKEYCQEHLFTHQHYRTM